MISRLALATLGILSLHSYSKVAHDRKRKATCNIKHIIYNTSHQEVVDVVGR